MKIRTLSELSLAPAFAFVFVLIIGFAHFPGMRLFAQAKLSLEEYLALAVKHSPGLQAAAVRMSATEHDIEALPRWYLPDLYVEAGYGGAVNSDTDRTGPLGRLISAWTLWDGGRIDAEREVAERNRDVSLADEEVRILGIRKALALAYYRAARLQELGRLTIEEIAEYGRLERSLAPRRRIGAIGASDVLNVRLRVGVLREEQEVTSATVIALRESLLLLAGLELNEAESGVPVIPILSNSFAPPESQNHEAELTQKIVERHPRYRVQQARLRLLKARQEYIERDLYGGTLAFEVYGGYGPDLDAIDPNKPEAGAGIRFRFPLYSSRDRKARLDAGQSRIDALRLDTEQKLRELRIELLEHHAAIERDRRTYDRLAGLVNQSRRSLRLGYQEFKRGQKAPADMVAGIELLYELRRKRLNTLLRLRLARFEEYSLELLARQK